MNTVYTPEQEAKIENIHALFEKKLTELANGEEVLSFVRFPKGHARCGDYITARVQTIFAGFILGYQAREDLEKEEISKSFSSWLNQL